MAQRKLIELSLPIISKKDRFAKRIRLLVNTVSKTITHHLTATLLQLISVKCNGFAIIASCKTERLIKAAGFNGIICH